MYHLLQLSGFAVCALILALVYKQNNEVKNNG